MGKFKAFAIRTLAVAISASGLAGCMGSGPGIEVSSVQTPHKRYEPPSVSSRPIRPLDNRLTPSKADKDAANYYTELSVWAEVINKEHEALKQDIEAFKNWRSSVDNRTEISLLIINKREQDIVLSQATLFRESDGSRKDLLASRTRIRSNDSYQIDFVDHDCGYQGRLELKAHYKKNGKRKPITSKRVIPMEPLLFTMMPQSDHKFFETVAKNSIVLRLV